MHAHTPREATPATSPLKHSVQKSTTTELVPSLRASWSQPDRGCAWISDTTLREPRQKGTLRAQACEGRAATGDVGSRGTVGSRATSGEDQPRAHGQPQVPGQNAGSLPVITSSASYSAKATKQQEHRHKHRSQRARRCSASAAQPRGVRCRWNQHGSMGRKPEPPVSWAVFTGKDPCKTEVCLALGLGWPDLTLPEGQRGPPRTSARSPHSGPSSQRTLRTHV